jgi:hypothetical protein
MNVRRLVAALATAAVLIAGIGEHYLGQGT